MINSEELHSKSTISCPNEQTFVDYVINNFDMNELPISGKLYHTLRVTKNCTDLSEKLGLDSVLGMDIGLLHDYARFSQWVKYHSYVDYKTEDHADMAVNMLFNEGDIAKFDIPDNYKPYIYYAVKYHNKSCIDNERIIDEISTGKIYDIVHIPETYINIADMLDYCKIARDGDKIDLINRIIAGEFKISYTTDGYSPECMKRLKEKTYVYVTDFKTKLDRIFTFIGFLYDINFSQSFDLFSLDDFFDSLMKNYDCILNDTDKLTLRNMISESKNNIIKKYGLNVRIANL